MSEIEDIIRIAAKGDGVTASGRHVPLTAPGDRVDAAGAVTRGDHHRDPPCSHFPQCGGCQLQHLDEMALRGFVHDRVVHAAQGQGITPEKVAPVHLSPPFSRRRAILHAQSRKGQPALVGFTEQGSYRLIDLEECHVLAPDLFALVDALRGALGRWKARFALDIALTLTDQGVACDIAKAARIDRQTMLELTQFAMEHGLARLTVDDGGGPDTLWEPEPATVTLSGARVAVPPGSFLQATRDGEDALVSATCDWLADGRHVADLFSGLGTFAFALATKGIKVAAYEAARPAFAACQSAARRHKLPIEAHHRDLFRGALQADELADFDAAVLDPPRAGARDQCAAIVTSELNRLVYISCNPSSWARDAKALTEAGFRLAELRPVGQFRWSTHVELASLFLR